MQQPPGAEHAHIPPPPPLPASPPNDAAAPSATTNTLAIVSLVAGVAGYVLPHPFIAGLVAIVTGHMARGQIRETGEGGAGIALIGMVLGYVHLALSILLVVLLGLLLFGGLALIGHSSAPRV